MIAPAHSPDETPRIAVLDDDPSVRKALDRLLRSAGYAVDTYSSGLAFLTSSVDSPPSCLVLDVHMPGMTGPDVEVQLHVRESHIPLVIISAQDDTPTKEWANEAGTFLLKPFDDSDFLGAVDGAVASASAA